MCALRKGSWPKAENHGLRGPHVKLMTSTSSWATICQSTAKCEIYLKIPHTWSFMEHIQPPNENTQTRGQWMAQLAKTPTPSLASCTQSLEATGQKEGTPLIQIFWCKPTSSLGHTFRWRPIKGRGREKFSSHPSQALELASLRFQWREKMTETSSFVDLTTTDSWTFRWKTSMAGLARPQPASQSMQIHYVGSAPLENLTNT